MPRISMTEEFVSSLARLDGADAKRVAAFLDKVVREPDTSGLHTEMVHDAGDRGIRSMRVTQDLRAILCVEPDRIVLLHVAHHDAAYAWAREHCIVCDPMDDSLEVVRVEAKPAPAAGGPPAAPPGRITCTVDDTGSLCEVLDAHGVPHELVT
jgi:mRNA-degrading endonuclease RelE of RelBE toxin-antitoxin system